MRPLALAAGILSILGLASGASADDGWSFRLTTPRGEVVDVGDDLLVAIPSGRAWGIASGFTRLSEAGSSVSADIAVADPRVREAFLRVAYYERGVGRPRQIEVADSVLVPSGTSAHVEVRMDPPDGARWYRVRILGRLVPGAAASGRASIVVRDVEVAGGPSADPAPRARHTRLIPAG